MTCLLVLTEIFSADLNANSDSSLPEDPPLQDFNHLNNTSFF